MPLAPAPERPKCGFANAHWLCEKWESGKCAIEAPPPGMSWYVLPPNEGVYSDKIQWFPTGSRAHAYLIAKRNDLVINPIARIR